MVDSPGPRRKVMRTVIAESESVGSKEQFCRRGVRSQNWSIPATLPDIADLSTKKPAAGRSTFVRTMPLSPKPWARLETEFRTTYFHRGRAGYAAGYRYKNSE